MSTFLVWSRASLTMLRRDRALVISSLGLAVISVFVFGWLFGSNALPAMRLGVVVEDGSATSAQVVAGLRQSKSLTIYTGTRAAELSALRSGERGAVIVLPPGFGQALAARQAQVEVYFDQSNPVTQATTRMAVQTIIASLNAQATGVPSPVTLRELPVSVNAIRPIDWITPGMLGMLLMWANLAAGTQLVQWRQMGILRRLAGTPLRPGTLVGAQTVARVVLSLAQGVILLAVAMAVFGVQVHGSWLALLATVLLGTAVMLALGYVIGAFAATPQVAQTITFLVSFPMMFLGGSYFATDNAPAFLAPIIRVLPLSYLNDALRQIINNGAALQGVQTQLLMLAAWAVAALLLSVRAFRWS